MVRNMGAIGDFRLFCHIFDIFCNYNHSRSILLTCWVLCDVFKIIFEAIAVICRLIGLALGSVIAKKMVAIANFEVF